MPSLGKMIRGLVLLCGLVGASLATSAQAQSTCGLTGVAASATPVVYDPFNATTGTNTTIQMDITRINPGGGSQTSIINFYLKANSATGAAANGIQLIPISGSNNVSLSGTGSNIFYGTNDTPLPNLFPSNPIMPSSGNRFLKIDFTGNNSGSDVATVNFQVIIPPNLSLNAVQNLSFDAEYSCYMQGGSLNKETGSGTRSNALVFPVTVLSALRTYYAGTALDFGEIGDLTTGNLGTYPTTRTKTNPANHVFVQSSGAYSVTLSSANGFQMKNSPGATAANDKIAYRLRFLGMDVDSGTASSGPGQTAISRSCQRATLSSTGNSLPIQATLLEGGSGKNPSSYSDTLTITITPLIYSDPGVNPCGGYGL